MLSGLEILELLQDPPKLYCRLKTEEQHRGRTWKSANHLMLVSVILFRSNTLQLYQPPMRTLKLHERASIPSSYCFASLRENLDILPVRLAVAESLKLKCCYGRMIAFQASPAAPPPNGHAAFYPFDQGDQRPVAMQDY